MSLRAIIIGLALVIIQTAVTPYNDYYLQGTDISGSHFPLGALFALIVLTLGINPILKKITPKAELNPGELMIVWGDASRDFRYSFQGHDGVSASLSGRAALFRYARKRMG